jgi:ATP-dependent protease Clp ATPase subunit
MERADGLCSFCGKSERQAAYVIAGPDVRICNECVALCVEILDAKLGNEWNSSPADVLFDESSTLTATYEASGADPQAPTES